MASLQDIEREHGVMWRFDTARFTVAFWAEPEDMAPRDGFCDERDIAYASDGEPAHWFCAMVGVFDEDGAEIARDALGGCSYGSFEEFYSAHRWQYQRAGARPGKWLRSKHDRGWKPYRGSSGSYFPQMVSQAINFARGELLRQRAIYIRHTL